ncbi:MULTISPECIES: hypothetical protein [Actinoalloteichus]|uniref:Uncharacterized protein n=1 Tax=Actinoalloteichus fjordicus TaxID=1612552 RepID=A0AAC9LC96_9PSEU|nr:MULTISPECIES: hypothetical protein [Actinoalloteichus]APU14956.1 hypothetical protein UA74_14490 [Actinoalloteichus fjordicus]APU21026.1 hypothetical protein UA75_15080 [Actinoalloteichus sp. GBA129-24]
MNVTVVGRGDMGGGPADPCEPAGHQVTRLGRGGVDSSEALLLAVPGSAAAAARSSVFGRAGTTVLDASTSMAVPGLRPGPPPTPSTPRR